MQISGVATAAPRGPRAAAAGRGPQYEQLSAPRGRALSASPPPAPAHCKQDYRKQIT
jgi:hypothetical protein